MSSFSLLFHSGVERNKCKAGPESNALTPGHDMISLPFQKPFPAAFASDEPHHKAETARPSTQLEAKLALKSLKEKMDSRKKIQKEEKMVQVGSLIFFLYHKGYLIDGTDVFAIVLLLCMLYSFFFLHSLLFFRFFRFSFFSSWYVDTSAEKTESSS